MTKKNRIVTELLKPQLACDAKLDKLVFPLHVQKKVDGVRLLVKDGRAVGRSFKQYKNKKLTSYLSNPLFDGFDGEIVTTHQNDPALCRLTTSQVNTIEGDLPNEWFVFDYLHPAVITLPYSERMANLRGYVSMMDLPSDINIVVSEQVLVHSLEELEALYASYLDVDYEGVIIRKQEGLHKNGRCTVTEGNYLRIKPKGDAEGVVVEVIEAMENNNEAKINELGHTERSTHKENLSPKGMIGSLVLYVEELGCNVKVGAGKLTHEERIYYFNNQDELKKLIIKYAFLATGQKDAPRHPRVIGFRLPEDMSK